VNRRAGGQQTRIVAVRLDRNVTIRNKWTKQVDRPTLVDYVPENAVRPAGVPR
jgi:hypothetical protein